MAVAYETSLTPAAVSFLAAGEAETVAFNAGTGADRVLLVAVLWRERSNVISGVTYNGVAMTAVAAKTTENAFVSMQIWRLANPASGSNDIVVTMGAGDNSSDALIGAWVGNTTDTATPVDGLQIGQGTASTASIVSSLSSAVTSAVGDMVVPVFGQANSTANISATATNYTERQDADNGSGFTLTFGDAAGAATVNPSATWNNGAYSVSWIGMGVNVNAAAGGGGASIVRQMLQHHRGRLKSMSGWRRHESGLYLRAA